MATQNFYRPDAGAHPFASPVTVFLPMRITRRLAHKLHSKLQVIMSQVEMGKSEEAVTSIHEMANFISSYVESRDEERDREQRERTEDKDG
jgi:hypothetical protein